MSTRKVPPCQQRAESLQADIDHIKRLLHNVVMGQSQIASEIEDIKIMLGDDDGYED